MEVVGGHVRSPDDANVFGVQGFPVVIDIREARGVIVAHDEAPQFITGERLDVIGPTLIGEGEPILRGLPLNGRLTEFLSDFSGRRKTAFLEPGERSDGQGAEKKGVQPPVNFHEDGSNSEAGKIPTPERQKQKNQENVHQ
jgi:hypothetical protein